jgi:1-acyl-sn-glycerol-3-phosphate acyltransferase
MALKHYSISVTIGDLTLYSEIISYMHHYPLRSVLQKTFHIIFQVLTHVEIEGLDKFPAKGGYLIAANHLSIVDPVVVFAYLKRDDVTALVAKKHLKNPFFRALVNAVGGIWLNRDEADTRALRAAINYLQGGGIIGISPEGTRSRDSQALQPTKMGVAYLADKASVPIIPVAIMGTENTFSKLAKFHRPHITVRFGNPFTLPVVPRNNRDAVLRQNTDEIMFQIAAMLPENYHGIYANHPRLQELRKG